jgi:hypothetical protein
MTDTDMRDDVTVTDSCEGATPVDGQGATPLVAMTRGMHYTISPVDSMTHQTLSNSMIFVAVAGAHSGRDDPRSSGSCPGHLQVSRLLTCK